MLLSRIRLVVLFTLLLIANWAVLLWLQSRPIATAHAQEQSVEAAQVAAVTPTTFSYQGVLRNADGSLANGSFKVTINLYNSPLGGTSLYSEVFDPVAVTDGLFGLVVGDQVNHPLDAALFKNVNLFLGISVGSDAELLPRQRLHPVPWSVNATLAQNALMADAAITATTAAIANTLASEGWKATAIREQGDSTKGSKQRADYNVEMRRYVVEANDAGSLSNSIPVDDTLLMQLCGDEDGCSLTLGMRNPYVQQVDNIFVMGFPYTFALANAVNGKRLWHSVGFDDAGRPIATQSVDGDSASTTAIHSGDCRFTDGRFANGQDQGDTALGFSLLNWYNGNNSSWNSPAMTCVLVIKD